MGLIDLESAIDNVIADQYSDARGPVIRGEQTEFAAVHFEEGEGARTHQHHEEQFVLVLEGVLRFRVGDESYDMKPGQVVFVPSDVPHGSEALERCRAVSFKNLVDPSYRATGTAE